MAQRIAGPGIGLPFPRGVLPERRHFPPFSPPTNRILLQGGQVLMVPAGNWIVQVQGAASILQYLDPTDEQWQPLAPSVVPSPLGEVGLQLFSDGFNYRVLNTAQVGLSALVTAPGSGYVQATTTVTPSAGNSTWQAIIGGALGNLTLTSAGSGYSIPPIVFIPAPSPPGHAARATATLAADGTVASLTLVNPGAGYKQAPPVYLIESPNEPNAGMFELGSGPGPRIATARVELTGAGTVTAVLLENFGAPLPAAPTLTITGSGTGATAVVHPTAWVAPATDLILLQPAAG